MSTEEAKTHRRAVVAFGLGVALALGCEGQASPSYRGEPLVSVSGQVDSALTAGDVEVGLLWLTAAAEFDIVCSGQSTPSSAESACVAACGEITCQGLESWGDCAQSCPDVTEVLVDVRTTSLPFLTGGVGQTTPAVGEFPAQFSLDILEPPPPEALIGSVTGERLALGMIVALDPAGQPWRIDLTTQRGYPEWLLGGSEGHFLLYAPDSIPDSSIWSEALGGLILDDGFHLMQVLTEAEDDDPRPATEVPDGDASQVLLRIAPAAALTWPLDLF